MDKKGLIAYRFIIYLPELVIDLAKSLRAGQWYKLSRSWRNVDTEIKESVSFWQLSVQV